MKHVPVFSVTRMVQFAGTAGEEETVFREKGGIVMMDAELSAMEREFLRCRTIGRR